MILPDLAANNFLNITRIVWVFLLMLIWNIFPISHCLLDFCSSLKFGSNTTTSVGLHTSVLQMTSHPSYRRAPFPAITHSFNNTFLLHHAP